MIKAVVFDLDHTLFDRHGTLRAIVGDFRKKFNTNPDFSDDDIAKIWIYADDHFVYSGWAYIFMCLKENGVFITPPDFADYRSFVFEEFAKTAVRFEKSLPMLETLKKNGYKVALITNGQHALQYSKLKNTGLMYVFDEIIVSGDVGVDKPDGEIFSIMCEKLGFGPEEMVYVGDNPVNDIAGAKAAGWKTIWMNSTGTWNPKAPDPDASVLSVEEVTEAVEKLQEINA